MPRHHLEGCHAIVVAISLAPHTGGRDEPKQAQDTIRARKIQSLQSIKTLESETIPSNYMLLVKRIPDSTVSCVSLTLKKICGNRAAKMNGGMTVSRYGVLCCWPAGSCRGTTELSIILRPLQDQFAAPLSNGLDT